jgi:putative ABC transport system permease protein
MRRVALATLAHDRLRTAMLIVGLGAVWALVAVQVGLRRGFERSARAVIDRAGGDLWVSAKGVRVVDDGEPIAPPPATADSCIARIRPVIIDYAQARRPDHSLVTVQIVALDDARSVGIDAADVEKLGLPADAVGKELELRNGLRLRIGTVSRGVRSFTQTPYVFVDLATAREIVALPPDSATFYAVDVRDRACLDSAERALAGEGRDVRPRESVARTTVAHWIEGSGIGTLLGAGSLMAAVVGAIVLLQSTLTTVRSHMRELATVRALGARRSELASFVAWQVGVVAMIATAIALGVAAMLARVLAGEGLSVIVDRWTCAAGALIAVASTAVAAFAGARVLGRVDPREVLE